LSFSDQQIVTGISLIIGGFSQIQGGLDIYHWQCVISMAWFSSVTHLLTLTILREEAKPNKTLRIVHITAMGALIFMILYGMVPIGYTITFGNITLPGTPIWCLFHRDLIGNGVDYPGILPYNWEYLLFSGGILILGFMTRVLLLFSTSILHLLVGLFHIPKQEPWRSIEAKFVQLKEIIAHSSNRNWLRKTIVWMEYKLLRSLYTLLVVGVHLYQSKLWEVHIKFTSLTNMRNLNWTANVV
jgi:hypothetical protein